MCFRTNSVDFGLSGIVRWSNLAGNALTTMDIGIRRASAGVMEVYDGTTTGTYRDLLCRQVRIDRTDTAGGTVGNQPINKAAGSVNFAATATSLVVTNSLVTTATRVLATVNTVDTTLKSVVAVCTAGAITLTANAAATAETNVSFLILNP